MPESESLGLLISGADELRKSLPMNEGGFNFMCRAHNLRGRDHYMYAVLDEIEQVAMALTLSQDWFDERPTDPATDDVGQRLLRNTFALVEREQALHIRRLTEVPAHRSVRGLKKRVNSPDVETEPTSLPLARLQSAQA